ncbi:MAG: metallophosphoesterase family protein [Bacteroidota bacterium]
MRRFAISDIHGCPKTFQALLDKIAFSTSDTLYLLGDFIDRGPDSKGVIDLIFQLQQQGYLVHSLRGNHDQMMLDALKSSDKQRLWLLNGGQNTLDSFQANTLSEIPKKYIQFIEELPYFFEVNGYLLSHAGFDFREGQPLQNTVAMMWIRRWYQDLDRDWLGDRIIVHGHTPLKREIIEGQLRQIDQLPVIAIDNGCVYHRTDMHQLCALDLDKRQLIFQSNME